MSIQNPKKDHGPVYEMMRGALGHRGGWLYLLFDEARKHGYDFESFARPAIRRMGNFHGAKNYSEKARTDMEQFAKEFVTEPLRNMFDMEIAECTSERFAVEFHHCPLLTGWQELTDSEEDLALICDIAMDGDRGIADTFPSYEFNLEKTIARGDNICRLVFTQKR